MTADEVKVLEKIFDTKLDPLSKQLDKVEKRLERVEEKVEKIDGRIGRLEGLTQDIFDIVTEILHSAATQTQIDDLDKRVTTLEQQHKN